MYDVADGLLKDLQINKGAMEELKHIYATKTISLATNSGTYEGYAHDPTMTEQPA